VFEVPSSTTFTGAGNNLNPSPTKPKKVVVKCSKGKKRRHGRCLKKSKKKKRRKVRRHA